MDLLAGAVCRAPECWRVWSALRCRRTAAALHCRAYISCASGRVTSVQLPNLGIAGSVPAGFVALNELEVLDLSGNK